EQDEDRKAMTSSSGIEKPKNRGKAASGYLQQKTTTKSVSRAAAVKYKAFMDEQKGPSQFFKVSRGGQEKEYAISTGYGYCSASLRKAENMLQLATVVEEGLEAAEIMPVLEYLGFRVPDIAQAAAVSASTVARWDATSAIGVPRSDQ